MDGLWAKQFSKKYGFSLVKQKKMILGISNKMWMILRLSNKSAICCHKDSDTQSQSQYPTILSAFHLDHSNGGELILPEIAFMCHYRMGDVVIMNGMQWHAVHHKCV